MSRDGSTIRYSGAPKYNGLFGRPSYIEFAEIASPVPIEWQVGDYVDYTRTGFRYKLYTVPQVAKSARSGEAGDAFVYKNVQFFCATKDLEIALFRDIVQYDNGIHFSSIPNVDTYENVYGIIDRIQANMDDFAPGQWTIRAMQTSYSEITNLMSEVRQFSVSDGTCMDALNQIYAIWKGISWIYKVENGRHTIVLGRPNLQDASNTTPEFSYGEGNGLKVLTRSVSTKNELATRIYAYGSDRNMPTRYYNNLTPYIKDHESVYIPHLMLPTSDWGSTGGAKDARLAYLENASAVNKYGLIPKVMRFDGSGDLEDIYPSVEGMTVGDVADSDFPATGWSSSRRIDTVVSAENPSDNGMYTEDSVKLKNDTEEIEIEDPDKTYTTVSGQEAVTIANDAELFETTNSMNTDGLSGHFVIKMGGFAGMVTSTDTELVGYLTDVPKAFIEIYVGDDLQTSKELKVTSTRMVSAFTFECGNITFTTESSGKVKAFIRIELKVIPSTPQLTLTYNLDPTVIKVNVEYSIDRTFTLHLAQLGFDLNALGTSTVDGLATISMRSGLCAGRDFVVKEAAYNEETYTWDLLCQRQDDSSLMQYFPNSVYSIESGDSFVILDIQMPTKFVTAAETRLHNAATNALARLCKPVMAYVPEVDSKEVFLASVTLVEGLYMPVYDPDLIETFIVSEPNVNWILIDTVTIAENEDVIPIWGVTLRDEKVESMLQVITGELNAAQKRLRDMDIEETRRPAKDIDDAVMIPTVVGVKIEAEREFFAYTEDEESQTIVLTAVTQGINNPTFQWYYLGAQDWVALSGETDQAYVVESDSSIYYQNGEIVEDFRVVVTDGTTSETYEDSIQITKLTGAVTIALNNPAHIFAGGVDAALPNQTDTVNVLAFNGSARVSATVNSISGQISGAITASVRANTNGTISPIIDIAVTDQLTDASGVLTINVTAAEVTVDLTYSWAVAFKGAKGDKGDTGLNQASIHMYRRVSTGAATDYPIGGTTYNFAQQSLTLDTGATFNGWSMDMPTSGTGPIYVTIANVTSNNAAIHVDGGWTPTGDWSIPVRLTGDNGLMGKIMRGVNTYSIWGINGDAETQTVGVDYQGRSDTATSHIYYDVVMHNDTLYYCEHDRYVNPTTSEVTLARLIEPGSGTTASDYVWVEATNFDFIATNVLLADNAFIDVLTGNGVYLYGNTGAGGASPYVVAGAQGGSTTEWPPQSGNIVSQVNFFAGTHFNPNEAVDTTDDTNVYPQTAPFRVDYEGNMFATKGEIGPYTIGNEGLVKTVNTYANRECQYSLGKFEVSFSQSNMFLRRITGNVNSPNTGEGILHITSQNSVGTQYPAITTIGDIKRNGESVITFDAAWSTEGYSSILHVVHCSQSDYDAMESDGNLDATTFYIIS